MKSLLVIIITFALGTLSYAGDNHNHEASVEPAPNGGILRDAAPYKAELVLKGDEASIYVYDKSLKHAVLKSESLEGTIRLPKQKKHTKVVFKKEGKLFKATLSGVSKVHRFDLHVYLVESGKKTLIDFGIDNIH